MHSNDAFKSENFFKLRASQYSNDWTGQQGGKYGQRFIQNGLRDFINEYVDASIPAYIKTRWTTSSYDQIKTKSGKMIYFYQHDVIVIYVFGE